MSEDKKPQAAQRRPTGNSAARPAGQMTAAQKQAAQKQAAQRAAAQKQAAQKPAAQKPAGNSLAKRGILKFDITDAKMLFACYMPFVKGCGIFLPTTDDYVLGDEAFLLLTLPDGKGKFSASAKVVWVNPKKKLGKREPGVGLQILGKDAANIRDICEEALDKKVKSPLPTATM